MPPWRSQAWVFSAATSEIEGKAGYPAGLACIVRMDNLLSYEHRRQPVASRSTFLRRLSQNGLVAIGVILFSLIIGMVGYHGTENMNWVDAFVNAAMILSGMGPVTTLQTDGGKIFAGLYAIYSGLLIVGIASLILAPVFHRVLHSFHVEDSGGKG